jgi:hypothetical protein
VSPVDSGARSYNLVVGLGTSMRASPLLSATEDLMPFRPGCLSGRPAEDGYE